MTTTWPHRSSPMIVLLAFIILVLQHPHIVDSKFCLFLMSADKSTVTQNVFAIKKYHSVVGYFPNVISCTHEHAWQFDLSTGTKQCLRFVGDSRGFQTVMHIKNENPLK